MAGDEFFQVFACFGNVFPQGFRGQLGIFRPAGGQELAVRPAGSVQVTRKDQVETGIAVTVDIQGLQEGEHERTIGGGVKRGVKTPVPLAPGLHFGILLEGLFLMNKDIFRALKILLPHVRDCVTQHIAFENGACFEHLHDLVG